MYNPGKVEMVLFQVRISKPIEDTNVGRDLICECQLLGNHHDEIRNAGGVDYLHALLLSTKLSSATFFANMLQGLCT
jgi:hypothetical protein